MLKHKIRIKANNAFTLAETLITIGIISVVSALTIPHLVTSYQKYQTAHKLKQTYAIFNQALKLSIAENGDPDGWNYTKAAYSADIENYILPHLKYNQISQYPRPKTLAQTDYLYWVPYRTSKIYQLHNGAIFAMMMSVDGIIFVLTVDINGLKGPNILGTDIFVFSMNPNETTTLGTNYSDDHLDNRMGMGCAHLIQQNNWEIPKAQDYKVNGKHCWYTDK
ncbi:type II secretion system protein [bacterium]|nr:type II secretion system protein [bacterium]